MRKTSQRIRLGPISVTRLAVRIVALAALLIGLGTALDLQAGGKKSDSQVKITASASKIDGDGNQVVTVKLAVNKGWHIYANPVGNSDLASSQTVVTVNAKAKPEELKVTYPPGKVTEDKVVGDYKVYEGEVNIKAALKRAAGDTGPLEVAIRFMACHEKGVCLLPATVKLTVK